MLCLASVDALVCPELVGRALNLFNLVEAVKGTAQEQVGVVGYVDIGHRCLPPFDSDERSEIRRGHCAPYGHRARHAGGDQLIQSGKRSRKSCWDKHLVGNDVSNDYFFDERSRCAKVI